MCNRVVSQMRAIDVRSCRDSNDGCKYKEALAIVILSRGCESEYSDRNCNS